MITNFNFRIFFIILFIGVNISCNLSHSVQRGINLPLENYLPPLIGQLPPENENFLISPPPLKIKIFWPPPNFCSFPDFVLEESVWHAINLWGHWKACSFTRDQNHSSNHSGVIKNFIFIKWHYIQVQFNPFQANVQFLCHLKTSEKQRFSNISREYSNRTLAWNR